MSEMPADEFQRLRDLLLVDERQELAKLRERLDDPEQRSREVAAVLSKAIITRNAEATDLTEALEPQIEESLARSIRENPQRIAEVIFPIIGPAIRRSIQQALADLVQRLNQTVEHSLTIRGLRMRAEALRSGVPFAEVVLRRSLVYRVEQLFLIDRRTGLLLAKAVDEQVATRDPDMVSSMLTVVQDFVRDSLRVDENEALDSVRVGELSIWIEPGPKAILAATIRGTPPESLRGDLSELLASLHLEYASALAEFDGDLAPFATVPPRLEPALSSQQKPRVRRLNPVFVGVALGILFVGLWWGGARLIEGSRARALVERLEAEPGIEAVELRRASGGFLVSGMRDPLAPDGSALVEEVGLDSDRVRFRWEPFLSPAPHLVVARIAASMDVPETVELSATPDGFVAVRGTSEATWVEDLRDRVALTAPGTVLDLSGWQADDVDRLAEGIASAAVTYPVGSAVLTADATATLRSVAADFAVLRRAWFGGTLVVRGHLDETGPDALNRTLRDARVQGVRAALVAEGVPADALRVESADDAGERGRRVTFSVHREDGAP